MTKEEAVLLNCMQDEADALVCAHSFVYGCDPLRKCSGSMPMVI